MRFFASKKRSVLSFALLAVFGIAMLLPRVALAQFGLGFIDGLGKAVEFAIAGFLLSVPTAILGIASSMLTLATDPSFIRIPYTTGPIIDTGWVVVRDFANMLIVFFLIIIGLATALRLRQYEAQVTLRRLVGVALLINFTPVITGFIVDTSNIFMNFFLEGLAGTGIIANVFGSVGSIIGNDLSIGGALSFIPKILLIGIFEVFAAIVFFLFAALFIVRRLAIWLLVILSPIAFVASILPKTNKLFDMWWNQFFQWSIIGVFAAFFLWLGDQIIGIAAQGTLIAPAAPSGGGIGGALTGTLNQVMPFGIALAMLLIGFFIALQSSAMGSGAVQAFTTKGMKWGGATVGTPLWRRFGDKTAVPGAKMAEWGGRLQNWGSNKGAIGQMTTGVLGWGLRKGGNLAQALPNELTKQVHLRDYDAFSKGMAETAAGKMGNSQDVFATINTELLKPVANKNRILGLLAGVRNRGDADDIQDAFDPKKNGKLVGREAMIGDLVKLGRDRIGPNGERPLFKAFYGQIMANPTKWGFGVDDKELQKDAQGNAVKDEAGRPMFTSEALSKKGSDATYLDRMKLKIPARMVTTDFATDEIAPDNYDPKTEAGSIFIKSMMKERGAEFVGPIIRRREQDRRQEIVKFLDGIKEEWFLENGAEDVLKWFTSTGAHNLGLSRSISDPASPGGLRQIRIEDVERLKEVYRPTQQSITKMEEQLTKIQAELAASTQPGPDGVMELSPDKTRENQRLRADVRRQEQELDRARARLQNQPPSASNAPSPSREGGPEQSPRGRSGATGSSGGGEQEKPPRGRPGSFA